MSRSRVFTASIALVALTTGCVTTTAHRLPLASNPMRQQAEACEAACRAAHPLALPLAPKPAEPAFCDPMSPCSAPPPRPPAGDERGYALCLDECPGTTAIDNESCHYASPPEAACGETTRANKGAIAGGLVAAAGGTVAVVALVILVGVAEAFGGAVDAANR